MPAAMQTPEHVCSWASILVERTKVALPICAIHHSALFLNGRHGIGPLAIKLFSAASTDKGSGVTTAGKPVLLLPTRKARCPKRDFLDDGVGNDRRLGIATNATRIGELGAELGVSRTIRDAPRTDAIRQLLGREDRTNVDVASLHAATHALTV